MLNTTFIRLSTPGIQRVKVCVTVWCAANYCSSFFNAKTLGMWLNLVQCNFISSLFLYILSILHYKTYWDMAFQKCCRFYASLFGIKLFPFLPLQEMYFRTLPRSLILSFQYIVLSSMILNIMHYVQDCNRVLEVRRRLVVSIVLLPHQSQVQGNKRHLSCALVAKKTKMVVTLLDTL